MKVLSIRQMWAQWIVFGVPLLGGGRAFKPVENRTRWLPLRDAERFAVHAGKTVMQYHEVALCLDWLTGRGLKIDRPRAIDEASRATYGAILGTVHLVGQDVGIGCTHHYPPGFSGAAWIEGPVCLWLADPRPLAKPVPWRGQQIVFHVPDTVLGIGPGLDSAARGEA